MKLKEMILNAWKNIKGRKKKSIIHISILTFIFLLMILLLVFPDTYKKSASQFFSQDRNLRMLIISYDTTQLTVDEAIDIVSKLPHVIKVITEVDWKALVQYSFPDQIGLDDILGTDETLYPAIIKGRGLSSKAAKELICPRHFTIDGFSEELFGHTYIDGDSILNTKVKLQYKTFNEENPKEYEEEYEVVGLYDEQLASISGYNCFTSFENVREINERSKSKYLKEPAPIVILDKKESFFEMEEVFENLRQELGFGINYHTLSRLDYDFEEQMNTLDMAIGGMVLFFLVIITVILIFYQMKMIKEREKEIGLWKAIGYHNGQIQALLWIEQVILILIAYLIAWLLFGIMVGVFFYLSKHVFYSFQMFKLTIPLAYLGVLLLGILVLSWIVYQVSFQKIKKINVVSLQRK